MAGVAPVSFLIVAVGLNAWLMQSRLDSFITAAVCALPLLRLQASLHHHHQAKTARDAESPLLFWVPQAKQHVVRLVVPITLACVMVRITSFGTSPFLTVFGALVATLQVCRMYTRINLMSDRVVHAILDRCPAHLRRVFLAGSLLAVILGVAVLGALVLAYAMYKEFQEMQFLVGSSTWARALEQSLPFIPDPEDLFSKVCAAVQINHPLIQDYVRGFLSALVHPIQDENTAAVINPDLPNQTKEFVTNIAAGPIRIMMESLPVLYYILAAEDHPWLVFHKICLRMGAQEFAERLMATLESILVCCCKRVAIYGMLGFCVAVLAGLPCPVMLATLSASQGLLPMYPPEALYFLVATWIGVVEGRIFMMVILMAIAACSAWVTLLTVHGQIPFQNRFYMGLCVVIGIQTFGPLGMILGPLIGSLPVLLSMTSSLSDVDTSSSSVETPPVESPPSVEPCAPVETPSKVVCEAGNDTHTPLDQMVFADHTSTNATKLRKLE